MNKLNFQAKKTGDTLEASEWNSVVSKVDELVEASNTGGSGDGEVIDSSGTLSISAKGNVTVNSNKNINLEPAWDNNTENYSGNYGDVAVKPGDDIQLCSHHREPKKRDKVVVKALDGNDNPVKLELGCGEIAITTKGKSATLKKNKTTGVDVSNDYMFKTSEADVMDVKILTGNTLDAGTADEREERGYLKVRAQAIDLRCEKHGGIALQPKGYDNEGFMNKIKFEHGGGDGLEFGTFNAEKTSIFTDEYRFKKDGIWKMSTRETEESGKTIVDEKEGDLGALTPTGAYKYKKNNATNNAAKSAADLKTYEPADDFYDFVDTEDEQTTTEAIIKTAAALNNDFIETSLSSKKNLKISAISTYKIIEYEGVAAGDEQIFVVEDKNKSYTKDELKLILSGEIKLSDYIDTKLPFLVNGDPYRLSGDITPKIAIEAEEEVGELVICTTAVIPEYYGNPELTAEKIKTDAEGRRWFFTGDLVKRIPDGKVRFAGRSKRIIKRGGNLVHAEEVEACLLTHERIEAAAVTDDLHPVIGQQIIAYVQTVDNQKITRGEVAKFFEGKLSAYKVPDKVIVVKEIPKDVGKVQFKYLREQAENNKNK